MLREIAHYAALLVGALFSVVVAVFGMSLGVIASRLRQLDSELETETKDLFGQISELKEKSHGDPHHLLKLAKTAIGKATARSRHLLLNRWLLSLWGALYVPSLMLLSAFVLFILTKIGFLSEWEISTFFVAVILTVYSLIHLALVVELVHKAVLLPEPPIESSEELKPELEVSFVDPKYSKVKIVNRSTDWQIRLYFRNRGEGQAVDPSISVIVPTTFTYISGTMKHQEAGGYVDQDLYYFRLTNDVEGDTNMVVPLGTVKTPTEPGNFKILVILNAKNSRVVRKSLQVLVQ